jgi:hypothetical protein
LSFVRLENRQNEGSFGCEAVARAFGQPNVPFVCWVSIFFVFMQQKIFCHSVVCFCFFTMNANVPVVWAAGELTSNGVIPR